MKSSTFSTSLEVYREDRLVMKKVALKTKKEKENNETFSHSENYLIFKQVREFSFTRTVTKAMQCFYRSKKWGEYSEKIIT